MGAGRARASACALLVVLEDGGGAGRTCMCGSRCAVREGEVDRMGTYTLGALKPAWGTSCSGELARHPSTHAVRAMLWPLCSVSLELVQEGEEPEVDMVVFPYGKSFSPIFSATTK